MTKIYGVHFGNISTFQDCYRMDIKDANDLMHQRSLSWLADDNKVAEFKQLVLEEAELDFLSVSVLITLANWGPASVIRDRTPIDRIELSSIESAFRAD